MEEEINLWFSATKSTMRYLLLLSAFLVLVACSEVPAPDDLPTQTPNETAVPAATQQQPTSASIDPTPTLYPIVEFQGVGLVNKGAVFGPLNQAEQHPAEAKGKSPAQPEHIEFVFDDSNLFESSNLLVYPIDHYLAMTENAPAHIDQLKKILLNRPVQPNSPLPLFPSSYAADSFLALPVYVNFEGGNGLSFITQVEQGSEQQLLYAFQGITDDDSYYVTALLPVKNGKPMSDANASSDDDLAQVVDRQVIAEPDLVKAYNNLSDSMGTLKIQPQDGFPSPVPPAYLSYPGVLLAYDPELSGKAVAERTPPIYGSDDGTVTFLPGVPDEIQVVFTKTEQANSAILHILPVRGATKQFFPAVPVDLQQKIQVLEAKFTDDAGPVEFQNGKDFERLLPLLNGGGLRHVYQSGTANDAEQSKLFSYQFQGVTGDGRYYIHLDHPVQLEGTLQEVLLNADSVRSADFLQNLVQVDQMIQSLIVTPDASTDSSIPVNESDCTLDAQFIEDVTIPDHSIVERGNAFTKTWRVKNSGTCTWTPAYQIKLAGGNPISWSKPSVIGIVQAGQVAEISVEILSPDIPANYQAWWQLADDMGKPFGAFYHVLFEAPPPATEIPGYGVIEGDLSYPAGGMPAMTIYFLRVDDSQRFALETQEDWDHYVNELPTGDYYVFARVTGDESDSGGGYTAAAVCGLTCEDHTLVLVTIEEGKATREINVLDWYAPAGTFPLP